MNSTLEILNVSINIHHIYCWLQNSLQFASTGNRP